MAIILELVGQDNQTLHMQSFDAEQVCIGRSLDNDFVITDPYVDASHAMVSRCLESDGFLLRDSGSLNGTRVGRRKLSGATQQIASGSIFQVGKTFLRISDSSTRVEPALKLTAIDGFYDWAGSGVVCTFALLTVLLYASFNIYLTSDAAINFNDYLGKLMTPLGTMVVAASFWAIMGRAFKRRSNFTAHLTIAALAQLVLTLFSAAITIVTINIDASMQLPWLSFIGRGLVLIGSLELHIRLATHVSLRRRLAFEFIVLCALVIYPVYKQLDGRAGFLPFAPYNSTLLPPHLQFYRAVPVADFLQEAADRLTEVQAAAQDKREELRAEQEGE